MSNFSINWNHFDKNTVSLQGAAKEKNVGQDESKGKKQGNGVSIFAGDSNLAFADQIGQKKADAQKNALKKILEVFERDLDLDQTIKSSDVHKVELANQIKEYDAEIEQLTKNQQELKENYGITDESDEEKNLNLLRKSLTDPLSITEEEMTQLEKMGPITEYQKSSLENDAMKQVWQELKDDAIAEYSGEGKKVDAIKQARLKSDPQVGAQKEAQAIKDSAAAAILSLIYEKAKETLDEKFGGDASDVKKSKEDEKELSTDKNKDIQKDEQINSTEDYPVAKQDILERLKKFMKQQMMLQEDVLEIKIDEIL